MKYKEKLYEKIKTHCKVSYEKLNVDDFELGEIPYNHRCHLNSVQKIKENKAAEIYLCVAWDNDFPNPVIHFINKLENGKYQDNTWGWIYEQSQYYIIRKVNTSEYDKIWELLTDAKKHIFNSNSSQFMNWIHKIDHNII